MNTLYKYYIIYKPYGMLSQFTKEGNNAVLGDLYDFPKDVYPVGRLDSDSEGLLILTNDKRLNERLLHPIRGHWRTYLVQVEGVINEAAVEKLRNGISININGKPHHTSKAQVCILPNEPNVYERIPPIRYRKNIPTSWIEIKITEGKNRQIRRMTAAVGHPALRIIRTHIGKLSLGNMKPADVLIIEKNILGMIF